MEDRRKVYVEVRARHLIDGTCRPESIKFENDEVYEIDRVKHIRHSYYSVFTEPRCVRQVT